MIDENDFIPVNPILSLPIDKKICVKCKTLKLLTDFVIDKSKRTGYTNICKSCKNDDYKFREFGITPEEYDRKFKQQNGLCAIRYKPEVIIDKRLGTVRKLAIDHDHDSKKIRDLLCYHCNLGLGWLENNMESVRNYLNKFAPVSQPGTESDLKSDGVGHPRFKSEPEH